jgi:hypothetical protein
MAVHSREARFSDAAHSLVFQPIDTARRNINNTNDMRRFAAFLLAVWALAISPVLCLGGYLPTPCSNDGLCRICQGEDCEGGHSCQDDPCRVEVTNLQRTDPSHLWPSTTTIDAHAAAVPADTAIDPSFSVVGLTTACLRDVCPESSAQRSHPLLV